MLVGGLAGRHAFLAGQGEDEAGGVENLGGPGPRPRFREAADLVRYLDQAAGIDHVVRRVQDATVMEQLVDACVRQLDRKSVV